MDRQAWPQYQRETIHGVVDRARSSYSSIKSPNIASRSFAGRTRWRSHVAVGEGQCWLTSFSIAPLTQGSSCEWLPEMRATLAHRQLQFEKNVSLGHRAPQWARPRAS